MLRVCVGETSWRTAEQVFRLCVPANLRGFRSAAAVMPEPTARRQLNRSGTCAHLDYENGEGGGRVNRDSERIYEEFLVAAAVTGDQDALSRLVVRWHPRFLRHAWRMLGDPERAKDMVQEAWVEILNGLARLDDVAAFPAWAYRIVTRRCQRSFHRGRREVVGLSVEELAASAEVPEHALGEFAAELSNVVDAIGSLPPPQRAALALFYIEELSVAEIAIATDVPPGTVKTRLLHARRKVRALLGGDAS